MNVLRQMGLVIFRMVIVMTWSVFIFSCTKAEPEMTLLSTELAAMNFTVGDPFANMDNSRYALFQGNCPALVTGFQVRADGLPWIDIPSTPATPRTTPVTYTIPEPDITIDYSKNDQIETAPPAVIPYDLDCSDGSFSFWIYASQFDEWVAAQGMNPNSFHPPYLYIRGITASGLTTRPTAYATGSGEHGGGNPPAKFILTKWGSPIGAPEGSCVELKIGLRDEFNDYANADNDVHFSLNRSINGSPNNSYVLYDNFNDCISQSSGGQLSPSNLEIPYNFSERRVYYNIPYGIAGQVHAFSVNYSESTPSLDTSEATLTLNIRSSSAKEISIHSPSKILVGQCYAIQVQLSHYGSSYYYANSEIFEITAPTEMEVSLNSDCTSPISSFSMPGEQSRTLYVRVTSSPVPTEASGILQISSADFDYGQAFFVYDKSGDNNVTYIRLNHPNETSVWGLTHAEVFLYNKSGAAVPATGPYTVNVQVSDPNKGYFCNYAACTGPVSSVTVPAGAYNAPIFYQATLGGTNQLTAGAGGVANYQSDIYVVDGVFKLGFSQVPSSLVEHFSCNKFVVETRSNNDLAYPVVVPLNVNISGVSSSELYSDPLCMNPLGTNLTISPPPAAETLTFYWRPVNTTTDPVVTTLTVSASGVTSAVFSGVTIQNALALSGPPGNIKIAANMPFFPNLFVSGAAPFNLSIDSGQGGLIPALKTGLPYNQYFYGHVDDGSLANLTITDARNDSVSIATETVAPRLDLDFVNFVPDLSSGAVKVDGVIQSSGWSFTRASTALYYNEAGYLAQANSDSPRFDHDPTSPFCQLNSCPRLGLLIEPASQNLIAHNTNFAAWTANVVQLTYENEIDPTGVTTSVATLDDNTSLSNTGIHQIYNFANGNHTASIYLKHVSGSSRVGLYMSQDSPWDCYGLVVNLADGSVTRHYPCSEVIRYKVSKLRNDWYRVEFTTNHYGGPGQARFYIQPAYSNDPVDYMPDWTATGRIYVSLPQVEKRDYATSPIITFSSPVTRASDVLEFPTTMGWSSGSVNAAALFVEFIPYNDKSQQVIVELSNATQAHYVLANPEGDSVQMRYFSTGAPISPASSFNLGQINILSIGFAPLHRIISFNNQHQFEGTSVIALDDLDKLNLGSTQHGSSQTHGHFRRLKYFEEELHPGSVKSMGFKDPE